MGHQIGGPDFMFCIHWKEPHMKHLGRFCGGHCNLISINMKCVIILFALPW